MDFSLEGKTALVCGASQGIGRACADALAELGAAVIVVSRRANAATLAAKALATPFDQRHRAIAADLSDLASVERLGAGALKIAGGTVHILVHNTGGPPEGAAMVNTA